MSRKTWFRPDGKNRPGELENESVIEVRYGDGTVESGEARDFIWSWNDWDDEDVIVEYRVLNPEEVG